MAFLSLLPALVALSFLALQGEISIGAAELSGGNWQKLAIARGLYRPHHVIAFDEPTAALDPLVEEQIIRSMMERGRLAGCGTHEELLGRNQIYTRLWEAQAKWYQG